MVRVKAILPKGVNPIRPREGQESAWDYPRPAVVSGCDKRIRVTLGDLLIADTVRALRALETSHPPGYYVPPDDVDMSLLRSNHHHTVCEWKGRASYYDLVLPDRVIGNVAWGYPEPTHEFEALKDYLSFYPAKVHCTVDGEKAEPQAGGFYGGWITSHVAGPFKGPTGTWHW